jgi:hypothetical protein
MSTKIMREALFLELLVSDLSFRIWLKFPIQAYYGTVEENQFFEFFFNSRNYLKKFAGITFVA